VGKSKGRSSIRKMNLKTASKKKKVWAGVCRAVSSALIQSGKLKGGRGNLREKKRCWELTPPDSHGNEQNEKGGVYFKEEKEGGKRLDEVNLAHGKKITGGNSFQP